MFFYLLLVISSFLAVWFLRVTRKQFYGLPKYSLSTLDVMLSPEDDDAKLELMQNRTGRLVGFLLLAVLLIVVAVAIGAAPYLLAPVIGLEGYQNARDLRVIVAVSVGASIPFFIPLKREGGYSELEMLLHRLVLDNYNLGLKLLRREQKTRKKKGPETRPDFVIVSGLARAGTTSLMNALARHESFRSLNYGNMPFLLSPNLWKKLYRPKATEQKERSHKDGIQIGLNSNEALEEYFFKATANDAYITNEGLREYKLETDDYKNYLDYQAVIRQDEDKIYLAKNNNFLLRYRSIRQFNSDFLFVLLFRHPLYHAASLREKHLQYGQMQQDDPFVLEYMDWLGHHEFGRHHKPFVFDDSAPSTAPAEDLNYWLEVWINYYQNALKIDDPQTLFVDYQQFCEQPGKVIQSISLKLNIKEMPEADSGFSNQRQVELPYSETLLKQALEIYEALKKKVNYTR